MKSKSFSGYRAIILTQFLGFQGYEPFLGYFSKSNPFSGPEGCVIFFCLFLYSSVIKKLSAQWAMKALPQMVYFHCFQLLFHFT